VPIFELLRKFDGVRIHDDIKAGRRRYRLTRLPNYLVLHMKRFTKNNFFWEKNPTIVNFPVRNLELRDIVPVPTGELPCQLPSPRALATHPCRRLGSMHMVALSLNRV
jgi:U4/U6.U5 tri-snRNP-associated protein 2